MRIINEQVNVRCLLLFLQNSGKWRNQEKALKTESASGVGGEGTSPECPVHVRNYSLMYTEGMAKHKARNETGDQPGGKGTHFILPASMYWGHGTTQCMTPKGNVYDA